MNESLIGKTFGKLKVIDFAEPSSVGKTQWLCRCSCNKESIVVALEHNLYNGRRSSCGCEKSRRSSFKYPKDVQSSRAYQGWRQFHGKFKDSNTKLYKEVLSKIAIDYTLVNDFSALYSVLGDVPAEYPHATVSMKDSSKGFVPDNIEWYAGDDKYRLVITGPRTLTKEEALENVKRCHGNFYDYSLFEYTGAANKVTLICPRHGVFSMRYSDLTSGSGCIKCAHKHRSITMSKSFDEYLNEAKAIHGDKYDYSNTNTDIVNGKSKVSIVCRKCGQTFTQRISRHALGNGCNKCQDYGFCETKPGYIYLLKSSSMSKVGITNRSPSTRLKEINKLAPEEFTLISKRRLDGHICRQAETHLHSILGESLTKPSDVFSGYTEAFVHEDFSWVEALFNAYVSELPEVGESPYIPKPPKVKETAEQRRARISAKTGLPVGVIRKYNKWYFQIIIRVNGKKDKKPLGAFEELSDCISYAEHYWSTGELIDTVKNSMAYNRYGLPFCITPCSGGFRVQGGVGKRKDQRNFYLGTFKSLDEAKSALEAKRKELEENE